MKSNVIQIYICAVVILVLGCTLPYIVQHKKPSLMRAFPLYKKYYLLNSFSCNPKNLIPKTNSCVMPKSFKTSAE